MASALDHFANLAKEREYYIASKMIQRQGKVQEKRITRQEYESMGTGQLLEILKGHSD